MAIKPWLELARISNLPTVWTNVLAGWLLADGRWDEVRLLWMMVGGSLAYTGGMILNDVFDVEWDVAHGKERPIPSGKVSRKLAAIVGLGSLLAGSLLFIGKAEADITLVLLLCAAILSYNWLHKRWTGSVLLMGTCRTLLYWVAGSAMLGDFDLTWRNPVFMAGIAMGIYIVALTMVARFESRSDAPKPVMAWLSRELLYTPAFILCNLVIIELSQYGRSTEGQAPAALIFIAFLVLLKLVLPLIRAGGTSIGRAVGWLLAGICIVDAMALCAVSVDAALWIAALTPALRLWQRKIAAT